MNVRLISAAALARVLNKSSRTIARWCDAGDIDSHAQGTGRARRYQVVVRDNAVMVCGIAITIA